MEGLIRYCYNKIDEKKRLKCNSSLGRDCFNCFSNMYYGNNEINYECKNKRYIYIVRYLPVHSYEIRNALRELLLRFYCEINGKKKIVFASFGAGPGVDTYAFHRWLDINHNNINCKNITAYRIESYDEWTALAKKVMFSNCPSNFEGRYYRHIKDVTTEDVKIRKKFDIATLSYIISELDDSGVDKLIENIKNNKNDCSYIIINDRNEVDVKNKIIKVMTEVANADYKEYLHDKEHCSFSYPNDIYLKAYPKVYCSSIYFVGKLK